MSKNKLITFITPSLGPGGIEKIVSTLSNYLAKEKSFNVNIICFSKKEIFYTLDNSVKVFTLPSSSFKGITLFMKLIKLRQLLKKMKPQCMISFGSMYNSFFLLASLGLPGKKLVSDRSNPWRNSKLVIKGNNSERHDGFHHYLLKQLLYPKAHKILAQTQLSLQIEQRNFGFKKVLYFPNPVQPVTNITTEKEKIILNVGRFVSSKRQKDLICIFSKIPYAQRRYWKLVFIGGGENYYRESKELANNLGIFKDVDFLGYINNVDEWYNKAAIFAFTSSSEGFPNALAEAMSYGCACISYNCVAGPEDLIDHNNNGLLIPVGNKIMFKQELTRLIQNDNLRENFQQRARSITDNYKIETIAQKLIDEII